MNQLIWVAFVTGLTTGGISCMAVQGGLLTTSLAGQIEADLGAAQGRKLPPGARGARGARKQARTPRLARPILLFLAAKLAAYTLLGAALGGLGSVLSLTPVMRGALQIAIAVFMIGNGLRMLNVHPVFRYFNMEPPAAVRRFIRRKSKDGTTALAPLLLGALTVLIPCGVTQSMMAVAIGTGQPLLGAVILFAFVLGTSPVFFGLVYLATKLGSLLEKWFVRLVAATLLILGLVMFDAGLNLVGSPVTFASLTEPVAQLFAPPAPNAGLETVNGASGSSGLPAVGRVSGGAINLQVTDQGYFPRQVRAPAGQAFSMTLTTANTYSCARAFVIPTLNLSTLLPASGSKTLQIPAQPAGTRIGFTCSMGMYTGEIIFE